MRRLLILMIFLALPGQQAWAQGDLVIITPITILGDLKPPKADDFRTELALQLQNSGHPFEAMMPEGDPMTKEAAKALGEKTKAAVVISGQMTFSQDVSPVATEEGKSKTHLNVSLHLALIVRIVDTRTSVHLAHDISRSLNGPSTMDITKYNIGLADKCLEEALTTIVSFAKDKMSEKPPDREIEEFL